MFEVTFEETFDVPLIFEEQKMFGVSSDCQYDFSSSLESV